MIFLWGNPLSLDKSLKRSHFQISSFAKRRKGRTLQNLCKDEMQSHIMKGVSENALEIFKPPTHELLSFLLSQWTQKTEETVTRSEQQSVSLPSSSRHADSSAASILTQLVSTRVDSRVPVSTSVPRQRLPVGSRFLESFWGTHMGPGVEHGPGLGVISLVKLSHY